VESKGFFAPRARRRAALVFSLLILAAAPKPALAQGTARDVLQAAMTAMGGEDRLRAITALTYHAVGERQMVEQSERPSGPYFIDHFTITETRDIAGRRTRIESTHQAYAADHWWVKDAPASAVVVLNGETSAIDANGTFQYAGGYQVESNDDQFAFAPERVLLTAAAAADLHRGPDVLLHGVPHHTLEFHHDGAVVRLSINAATNLPWMVTFTRAYPYNVFLNPWGDVTTSITYSAWTLEPFGISYPREWTSARLNLPDQQIFIVDLKLNPPLDEAALTLPPDMVRDHPHPQAIDTYPLGFHGSGKPHELAGGILEVPGGWNVTFVRQSDGIVLIEAPWSTGYTQRAIDLARATFSLPVKAVVTTSDSWPHIAGVRQAVADGIPVYALDLNEPILHRLLAAPHTMHPDALAIAKRTPRFVFVAKPTVLGSGTNRLVIYPYRTATAERQMMIYFPEHRLLYTSDLFSQADSDDDWFTPQYLHEAIGAIRHYGLEPETVFGMHYTEIPYQKLVDAERRWIHG
jgi:hypothetical protein